MIQVVKLKNEQWAQIKPDVSISRYGTEKTIFESIEEIINADKIVTLNGSSMWKQSSTNKPIAKRIEELHKIFELPDGKFAVSSQTFNNYIDTSKKMNVSDEQIRYYNFRT